MYHRARTHRVLHKTHTLAVYLYKMQWMCRVSYRDFYFDGSCLCSCYSIHPNMKCIQTIQLGNAWMRVCILWHTIWIPLFSVFTHTHTHTFRLAFINFKNEQQQIDPETNGVQFFMFRFTTVQNACNSINSEFNYSKFDTVFQGSFAMNRFILINQLCKDANGSVLSRFRWNLLFNGNWVSLKTIDSWMAVAKGKQSGTSGWKLNCKWLQ